MKSSVEFYRLGEPGLILVWRPAAGPGALRLAEAGSFAPETVVAELPEGRRFAVLPECGGALRRLYWRTTAGQHGSASFSGHPPDEAGADAGWMSCSIVRPGVPPGTGPQADAARIDASAPREGLRVCCRPETGGGSSAFEWSDAAMLAKPRVEPRLEAFFTFCRVIAAQHLRKGAEIHGDLEVRMVPGTGLKDSVRVWIDRLHPQDLIPERMSGYEQGRHGWSSELKDEWLVAPGSELQLKIPRLVESPTQFRPARHAVDERDIMIVRTWPEIAVQAFIVPPRVENSDEKRPEPSTASAVEFVAGELLSPEPGRALVETMQRHWEQRRTELAQVATQDDWGNLPPEVRRFLADYQRWLPDWTPERLAAILRGEWIFPALVHLPPSIGAGLIKEAAASAQKMAQAVDSADADGRLAAFFDNPGLFHTVADDAGFARTLAQAPVAAPPPRPFAAVRWLAARLPHDPRLAAVLPSVSGKSALHYLAALTGQMLAESVIDLLVTGFVPASSEEMVGAYSLLQRLQHATDLSTLDAAPELVAEAPQATGLRTLRQLLDRGGYRLAELEKWVTTAESAQAELIAWCAATVLARRRQQLIGEVGAVLRAILPVPEPADAVTLQQSLESAVAGASAPPEIGGEPGSRVEAGRQRLADLLATWQEDERGTRAEGQDDGLGGTLELFAAHLTALAYREAAETAKGDLHRDLERLAENESILGPDARAVLAPLVEQARAHLSESPSAFFDLPTLQAELHARLEAILPEAAATYAAATRLLPAMAALAGESPGAWTALRFENSEQFAADFAQRRPAIQADLERIHARTQEAEQSLDALARIIQPDTPALPEAAIPAWPDAAAGTAPWADALAHRAETLPARITAVREAGNALGTRLEVVSWPHGEPVTGALRAGRYADALEIARRAPLRAQLEVARDEAARLLAPSGDALALLALTPPLVSEGKDAGWFTRARELLGELGPEANVAAMEGRLVGLRDLRGELLQHDAEEPLPCRSILLGTCRARCKTAHERLNQDPGKLTPELQALAQVPFERWSAVDLRVAEKDVL